MLYQVFIDEAGDLGNSFLKDCKQRGSYWFIMSAIIIKKDYINDIEADIKNAKNILNKKQFHFIQDKHTHRLVFLNKISKMNKFQSITIAQDKMELAKICQMCDENFLLSAQKIFEHVVTILCKEIHYMFSKISESLDFEIFFEENKNINYKALQEISRTFSKDNIKIDIKTCNKDCECIQIADYFASSIFQAFEQNKIDEQIDTSYVNKLIGNIFHYDDRSFPNLGRLSMCRMAEGPYKHRIKLLSSHAYGVFFMKKQGWARFIHECF